MREETNPLEQKTTAKMVTTVLLIFMSETNEIASFNEILNDQSRKTLRP